MKPLRSALLAFFLPAALALALSAPTTWPTTFTVETVGPIADYLNEPIYAARILYNNRLVAQGKPRLSTEEQWDSAYLPLYPRDGWLRYPGLPPYQIIGPLGLGGFGLHEFQGHPEIRARIDQMQALATAGGQPEPVPTDAPAPAKTPTPTGCIDTPLGQPGPFGQCFTCAGEPVPNVENRNGRCVLVSPQTPTERPTEPVPTAPPARTPTPCIDVPGGRPGPFGWCYDCAGNQLGEQPCAAPTVRPTPRPTEPPPPLPTATEIPPTEIPTTATATVTPTSTPAGRPKGCGGLWGGLLGGLAALIGLLSWRGLQRR